MGNINLAFPITEIIWKNKCVISMQNNLSRPLCYIYSLYPHETIWDVI